VAKGHGHRGTLKYHAKQPPPSLHLGWIPSVVGLAVSGYLFGLDLFATRAFCLARLDCETVRTSAFAKIFGVPVAAIGILFFGAALGLCLMRGSGRHRWLVVLSGIGVGGSVVFLYLQGAVLNAVCPYCLVAEAAAVAIAYLVVKDSPRVDQIRVGSITALAAVILLAVYTWAPAPTRYSEYAARLAHYLTQSGVVMYGAYWCPHCQEQKAMFGPAARLLPYVECDPRGIGAQPDRCRARGIRVYPTWEFHGQLEEGVLTIDELAQRSGFPSPPPGR